MKKPPAYWRKSKKILSRRDPIIRKIIKKYKNTFGFPFILAVKGKNKLEILDNFKKRILSDEKIEFNEAIKQVKQIANLRLSELKKKFI
jgi:2-oxo-4-hydroxy-4-carboxy--5-ureidoimidazoline (OHCU) decarboxylase